ncbi:MAG: ATP-binding protein [Acidimicrobiales bacterium]
MRIRSKLLLLLVVPLLAVTVAAAAGFRAQSAASEQSETAIETARRVDVVHRAAAAIVTEQLVAAGAPGLDPVELAATTDQALADLAEHARVTFDTELTEVAAEVEAMIAEARSSTDPQQGMQRYGIGLQTLVAVEHDVAGAFATNEALNQYLVTRLVGNGIAAQIEAWFTYLSIQPEADTVRALSTVTARFTASQQNFITAGDFSSGSDEVLTASMTELARLEAVAMNDLADGQITMTREQVLPPLTEATVRWMEVIEERDTQLLAMIQGELDDAANLRSLFSLLAIVGAVVLGGMVFVIYRSITNPLNDLLVRADEVAHTELPALVRTLRQTHDVDELPSPTPIPSTSNDEIGELIEAFNDVQLTAYDLATEQAIGRRNVGEMFVNLGRRNQQLLQRMLGKLTELERDEEDPDTLEDLFHLDNIVTRMRRNAESLLVLAGSQTPRQWSAPVPIDDTVRAAFGEVEGYERIDIAALSEADIRGNVVADVAHLLAELLENSLNFSAASTKVLVSGQHERGGYLITIFDQGIGMSPDELEEANRRVSDPPPLDQVPTKFLGLFVVGRLADRHGIEVRLLEAPGRGVMARITLPDALLAGDYDDTSGDGGFDDADLGVDIAAEIEAGLAAEHETLAEPADLPERVVSEPVEAAPSSFEPVLEPSPFETAPSSHSFDDDQAQALAEGLEHVPPVFATADADPGDNALPQRTPTDLDELPVRRRGDDPAPAAAASAPIDGLPTRTPGASARNADPVEPTPAPAAEPIGELPSRSRGASLAAPAEMPRRRSTDDPEPQAADASEFSSMMSAFSTGISRGLEESRIEASLDDLHTPSDPGPIANDERSES